MLYTAFSYTEVHDYDALAWGVNDYNLEHGTAIDATAFYSNVLIVYKGHLRRVGACGITADKVPFNMVMRSVATVTYAPYADDVLLLLDRYTTLRKAADLHIDIDTTNQHRALPLADLVQMFMYRNVTEFVKGVRETADLSERARNIVNMYSEQAAQSHLRYHVGTFYLDITYLCDVLANGTNDVKEKYYTDLTNLALQFGEAHENIATRLV
jgi:hypothetical protein